MRKWLITSTFIVLEKAKIVRIKEKEVEKQL